LLSTTTYNRLALPRNYQLVAALAAGDSYNGNKSEEDKMSRTHLESQVEFIVRSGFMPSYHR